MKKAIIFLICIFLLVIYLGMYWFQFRPANIRHECSWIKVSTNFVPEVTQEQAYEINTKCLERKKNEVISTDSSLDRLFASLFTCDKKPSPAEPAKTWYRAAETSEYQFCIHSHGL
jgi:hypothetical protein